MRMEVGSSDDVMLKLGEGRWIDAKNEYFFVVAYLNPHLSHRGEKARGEHFERDTHHFSFVTKLAHKQAAKCLKAKRSVAILKLLEGCSL